MPKIEIPTPENEDKQNPSPVLDAVKLMTVGDSITIIYPMDSLPQRPPPPASAPQDDLVLSDDNSVADFLLAGH